MFRRGHLAAASAVMQRGPGTCGVVAARSVPSLLSQQQCAQYSNSSRTTSSTRFPSVGGVFHSTPIALNSTSIGTETVSLLYLAQEGRLEEVTHYLEDQSSVVVEAILKQDPKTGITPLYQAVCGGHLEVVKLLLSKGANPNTKLTAEGAKRSEYTPLLAAMRTPNSFEIAEALLESGADPNVVSPEPPGYSVLYIAAGLGHRALVDLFLKHGADPNLAVETAPGVEFNPFNVAVANLHVEIAKKLLEAGSNCSKSCFGDGRMTSLHFLCCQSGNLKQEEEEKVEQLVCLLVEHSRGVKDENQRVDVDAFDLSGTTPLMRAAEFGNTNILRLLMKEGSADVNVASPPPSGVTALHYATVRENFDAAKILLEEGKADPNILSVSNTSPLKLAVERNNPELTRLLLESGANPEPEDKFFAVPLHVAACIGATDCTKLLLKHGADPGKINPKDGNTPLKLARMKSKVEVAQLLEEALGDRLLK